MNLTQWMEQQNDVYVVSCRYHHLLVVPGGEQILAIIKQITFFSSADHTLFESHT